MLFKKYAISMKFNVVKDTSLSIAFAFNRIYWECGRFFVPTSSIQGLPKEGSVQRSIVALDYNRDNVINFIMIFRTSFLVSRIYKCTG
jgi:hypothetical protein